MLRSMPVRTAELDQCLLPVHPKKVLLGYCRDIEGQNQPSSARIRTENGTPLCTALNAPVYVYLYLIEKLWSFFPDARKGCQRRRCII